MSGCAAANGSLLSITIRISRPARRRHTGTGLDFVVGHALQGCRSNIEERAQPRRMETDVDLVDVHLDPVDQGSKDSTLACHGQLGPALADICGPRDQPLLH